MSKSWSKRVIDDKKARRKADVTLKVAPWSRKVSPVLILILVKVLQWDLKMTPTSLKSCLDLEKSSAMIFWKCSLFTFENLTMTIKVGLLKKANHDLYLKNHLNQKAQTSFKITAPPIYAQYGRFWLFTPLHQKFLKPPLFTIYHHKRLSRSNIINFDSSYGMHPFLTVTAKST